MITVYLVDDSEVFVTELILTVPWAQLQCQVVGSALEASTAENEILTLKPDLVITDISMPGRDGLKLIQSLQEKMPELEFILVSAYAKFEYAFKAIKLGTADYFVKPFDDEEFYAAIQRVAERILTRKKENTNHEVQSMEEKVDDTQPYYLKEALKIIDERYQEKLSAASIAKELFISESYLCKLFRQEMDTSFTEYLVYIRVRKAMGMIKNTSMKFYEIAEATGFGDSAWFATQFRRITGISPSQYKASVKGKRI